MAGTRSGPGGPEEQGAALLDAALAEVRRDPHALLTEERITGLRPADGSAAGAEQGYIRPASTPPSHRPRLIPDQTGAAWARRARAAWRRGRAVFGRGWAAFTSPVGPFAATAAVVAALAMAGTAGLGWVQALQRAQAAALLDSPLQDVVWRGEARWFGRGVIPTVADEDVTVWQLEFTVAASERHPATIGGLAGSVAALPVRAVMTRDVAAGPDGWLVQSDADGRVDGPFQLTTDSVVRYVMPSFPDTEEFATVGLQVNGEDRMLRRRARVGPAQPRPPSSGVTATATVSGAEDLGIADGTPLEDAVGYPFASHLRQPFYISSPGSDRLFSGTYGVDPGDVIRVQAAVSAQDTVESYSRVEASVFPASGLPTEVYESPPLNVRSVAARVHTVQGQVHSSFGVITQRLALVSPVPVRIVGMPRNATIEPLDSAPEDRVWPDRGTSATAVNGSGARFFGWPAQQDVSLTPSDLDSGGAYVNFWFMVVSATADDGLPQPDRTEVGEQIRIEDLPAGSCFVWAYAPLDLDHLGTRTCDAPGIHGIVLDTYTWPNIPPEQAGHSTVTQCRAALPADITDDEDLTVLDSLNGTGHWRSGHHGTTQCIVVRSDHLPVTQAQAEALQQEAAR